MLKIRTELGYQLSPGWAWWSTNWKIIWLVSVIIIFKHALTLLTDLFVIRFMLFSILNEHRTIQFLAKPAYNHDQAQFTCRLVSQQEVECWHKKAKENKHKHFHNYFQLAMQLLNKSCYILGIVCQGVVTISSLDSQILCIAISFFTSFIYYFSRGVSLRQSCTCIPWL